MTVAEQYARDIIKGKVLAGEPMILAANRFVSDLERDDILFDEEDAERYCDFIESNICLWEGQWRGQPFIMHPYQKFIVQNIFGWKIKETGYRRFRDAYIQMAKKQAKTTLMAAIAWAHLLIDETEPTPQIIVGANNEEQARLCVNCCGQMVDVSPTLSEIESDGEISRLSYGDDFYRVVYRSEERIGVIKAISKEKDSASGGGTKAGKNPSLIIIDEYMAAPTDSTYKELRNAQNLRQQPLLLVITTPGTNKQFPCYTKLRKRAIGVLEGKVKLDDLFAAPFEMDEKKWEDPKEWIKTNPIVEFVPDVMKRLLDDLKTAKEEGGTSIVDFKTKNLGIWCDAASQWIPSEIWVKNHNPKLKVTDIEGDGFLGLDLSATRDTNSMGSIFPNAFELNGKTISALVSLTWLPHDNIVYRGRDYSLYVDRGELITSIGNHLDEEAVLKGVLEFIENHSCEAMFYDKLMSTYIPQKLSEKGIETYPVSMKGFTQSKAIKRFERMAYGEQLEHFNNSLLEMHLNNTVAVFDNMGQHVRLEKEHPENKIDATIGEILAFDCWMFKEMQPKKSAGFVGVDLSGWQ